MKYSIIEPPFTLQFSQMSKKELKEYAEWFYEILPERISILSDAIKQTQGFENWVADFSQESLDFLGQWFVDQVEVRSRTSGEINAIESKLKFSVDISSEELTDRTFSLAMDIGMYLSQVYLHYFPNLKWSQTFGSKNNADYGQPVLSGFGVLSFNPVWMMVTFAYGVVSKRKTGKDLRALYEIWRAMIK